MPMSKKKYDEANAKRKAMRRQNKLDGASKFAKPKEPFAKKVKPKKLSPRTVKTFNKLAKSQSKKSLARKVVSKFGLAGKAAVGASIAYDIIRGVKPQKQGVTCSQGHRTVKDGGKTYCISNVKIKKAKMKTTNKAVVDMKSKR
jgi:hypothetical protein